ncbi:MAG: hypothetical protein NTW03_20665 [Verrucomicrobia bacterium]|nr:hypothetical protein [Verrucomicrobiota bacterium]
MKKVISGIIVGLVLGGAAGWFYQKQHAAPEAKEEKKTEEKKEPSFVQHGPHGETFLKLNQETQARMGLKSAPLAAARMKPEVKGYGRILDPAPLAALLVEGAGARAALEASAKEFERLKGLAQTQNASARALEAAEAAMKRDQILLDSVQPRLLLGWGKAVAAQPDLAAFARPLAAQEAALARVDLPLSESLKAPPTAGRLAALTAPEHLMEAQFLGSAPSADPQMQGQGFFFLQKSNPLPPGAAVVAWLTVPGEVESGVTVPREALLRHAGEVFVYLQTGDDIFVRQEIELDRPTESGWFVRAGLKAQDKVVTVGAQQLLSEELKGQGGE